MIWTVFQTTQTETLRTIFGWGLYGAHNNWSRVDKSRVEYNVMLNNECFLLLFFSWEPHLVQHLVRIEVRRENFVISPDKQCGSHVFLLKSFFVYLCLWSELLVNLVTGLLVKKEDFYDSVLPSRKSANIKRKE